MKKKILIRFGDMMLKGKNIGFFIKRIRKHMVDALSDLEVTYQFTHDRIFIDFNSDDEKEILSRLDRIPGLYSYSIIYVTTPDLESIIEMASKVLDIEATKEMMPIKIETIRSDKSIPMTSLEITLKIASPILNGAKLKYKIDVKHPEEILYIDIRKDFAYIFMKSHLGMGGYPYGTQGKGLLMMSGGLDSPVAGYLAMKQGIEVELIHFESTPLTSIESVQKVIDLAKILAAYTPSRTIQLHLVPFAELHQQILSKVFDPYIITVMRRMMYRTAEKFAKRNKHLCLINGESVGQVASQTLPSMQVIEAVTKIPILRPLVTYDKIDIIRISKKIDAYKTSIKPFNDCCSIYIPKSPVTKPMEVYANKYEKDMQYDEQVIYDLSRNTYTLDISTKSNIDLTKHGFTVFEAIQSLKLEESDQLDNIETK